MKKRKIKMPIEEKKHKRYYNSDNNCLTYGGKCRLIEVPKFIYLRIKWAYQRIKYGYCDYDVYDVDYWLSRTLSSALYQLADITHGYPPMQVAQYLHDKEIGFVRDDYDILDEEFKCVSFSEKEDDNYFEKWQEIIRSMADKLKGYGDEFFDTEEYKKYENDKEKLYKLWDDYDTLKYKQAREGLVEVSKWFGHLWD